METRINFLRWLSTKLWLINVGMYATMCVVMVLPAMLTNYLAIPSLLASFSVFFVVSLLCAAYESLIIYEAPIQSLSPHKMLILSLVISTVMMVACTVLKPNLGYFSIPVALIISMLVVGNLKVALWKPTQRLGFFAELPAKLKLISIGRYGFYGCLVGIAVFGCKTIGMAYFPIAFPTGFFLGMFFEERYNQMALYEQPVPNKTLSSIIIWSAVCAIASTVIILVMINQLGCPSQAATITRVVILKLVQPLISRKFILGL